MTGVTTIEEILLNAIDSHRLLAHQAKTKGWERDVAIYTARERFAQGMLSQRLMRLGNSGKTGDYA